MWQALSLAKYIEYNPKQFCVQKLTGKRAIELGSGKLYKTAEIGRWQVGITVSGQGAGLWALRLRHLDVTSCLRIWRMLSRC
jgi:hypothetical protein